MPESRNLVAVWRADKAATERHWQKRAETLAAIREAVRSGAWKIQDVADLTGASRETIRKIVDNDGLGYVNLIPRPE
jgi:hypothetical protein